MSSGWPADQLANPPVNVRFGPKADKLLRCRECPLCTIRDRCTAAKSERFEGQKETNFRAVEGATPLVQDNPRAGCAIQQPLDVEAGKLILRLYTNMRCEYRDCTGVARFQFAKCLQITPRRGIFVLFRPQWLEGTQCIRPAPQQKVPLRAAPEVFHLCREDCADANAGVKSLVKGVRDRPL